MSSLQLVNMPCRQVFLLKTTATYKIIINKVRKMPCSFLIPGVQQNTGVTAQVISSCAYSYNTFLFNPVALF